MNDEEFIAQEFEKLEEENKKLKEEKSEMLRVLEIIESHEEGNILDREIARSIINRHG